MYTLHLQYHYLHLINKCIFKRIWEVFSPFLKDDNHI